LGAHEDRQRIQRRIPGNAHGGLILGESPQGRLRRIGCQQRGVFSPIRHVGLVGRCAAHAHLAEGDHHLQDVEVPDDLDQLGRRAAGNQPDHLSPWDIDIHQHVRQALRRRGHGLRRYSEVQGVHGDEQIQHIHRIAGNAVHLDDSAVRDGQRRLGVERAVGGNEPYLGPLMDLGVLLDGALGARRVTPGSGHGSPLRSLWGNLASIAPAAPERPRSRQGLRSCAILANMPQGKERA